MVCDCEAKKKETMEKKREEKNLVKYVKDVKWIFKGGWNI